MGKVLNPKATWYEGDGRLLAQYLFGCVFPLSQLETGWPEVYKDLLKVAKLLNKHIPQERIKILIAILYGGIKAYNKKARAEEEKKHGKV